MNKDLILIALGLFLAAVLTGCNTFRGAGKDVENTGHNIQKTVNHND